MFPTGIVTPNTVADDCDAFLRAVDGRHEDSPGGFPGIQIEASFDPAGPAPEVLTIRPPEGQLGNPFGAHQCTVDEELCDGREPAFSPNVDDDQTEQDGAKVGNVTFVTNGPTCPSNGIPGVQLGEGCSGEVLNYDARALDNPDDRGAPAAQALVVCQGLVLSTPATFCAGNPARTKVFAEAGPIDVVPSEDRKGDYQLSSDIDFTHLENVQPGEQITDILINQFGLVLQSPADPRQDPNPNDEQAALPFIFNPTACITATSIADATFADDSSDTDRFQTFPNSLDAAPDDNERAWLEDECEGYPWNHREVDPENSTVTGHNTATPTNDIAVRDQPENPTNADPAQGDPTPGFDGTTEVTHNTKIGDDDEAPVSTPSKFQFRFLTPTRGGIEYQSHYKEISITLKDTYLNGALAGRPGFRLCTPEQFDAGAFEAAECPDGSLIANLNVLSPLADGDLGPVPCHNFPECSKVNPFVYADEGCRSGDPEAPCDNLEARFDPADWPNGPGANLDPIPGDVWAGPQVDGELNKFRIFAEIRNNPDCRVNPPNNNPNLCSAGEEVRPRLHVKIQGIATLDEKTGEVHAVFDDLPELPVFHAEQAFPADNGFGALVSPDTCGEHKNPTELTPWAALRGDGDQVTQDPPAAEPDDSFTTSLDGHGADCPQVQNGDSLARSPFRALDDNPFPKFPRGELALDADPSTAAADTALTTKVRIFGRPSPYLNKVDVRLPDGLLGVLRGNQLERLAKGEPGAPMCNRHDAREGDCPEDTKIGDVKASVAPGGNDIDTNLTVKGDVFFSRPGSDDEVARITVVLPDHIELPGPDIDLGEKTINELAVKLRVHDAGSAPTAQVVDLTSGKAVNLDTNGVDKFPTILIGIPVNIRKIDLAVDRDQFLRNPVTCDTGTAHGLFHFLRFDEDTDNTSFTPTGCDSLAFTPKLSATLGSDAIPVKVGGHPPLDTVTTQPDHQAVIKKAVVSLPSGLFANVAALQNLCSVDQANANACPDNTRVGSAKAVSPLLPDSPLTGSVFIAVNPTGGLPRLVMRLTNDLLAVPLEANTTLSNNRLVTTLDNLPAAPVSSFQLTIDGGPNGLFTVGNALCQGANVDSTFTSHTGQTANDSSPLNLVGSCTPVPGPSAAAKPSLSVSLRHLTGAPLLTVRARTAKGAAKIRSMRLAIPSRLVVNRAALKRGVAITAGGKRLKRSSWSLSRSGVLTIKVAKKGSTLITATIQSGALRTNTALKRLARGRKALPRMTFAGRLVDTKNARYGYSLKVRPLR